MEQRDLASASPLSESGAIATATWSPPEPTLVLDADLSEQYDYEVLIYDESRGRTLVAAVEIVSPAPGSTFSTAGPTNYPLIANITDAEHDPGEYTCRWQTILHHDEHVHPEPYDFDCAS